MRKQQVANEKKNYCVNMNETENETATTIHSDKQFSSLLFYFRLIEYEYTNILFLTKKQHIC